MQEWLALLIPIFFSLIALVIFKHKLVWFEVILPTIVCIAMIAIMKSVMVSSLTEDEEYLTEYVVDARYYERWDEYVHRTCTRTVSCGKNCTTTVSYDCSYVRDNDEYWEVNTNSGNTYRVSEQYYNYVVKFFGNKSFVDMHRDYHSIDGDMYKTNFPGDFNKIIPYSFSETYENKTQAALTVFKFKECDSIEKKGLYEYPKIIDKKQNPCLGCTKQQRYYLDKFNAFIGRSKQIKIFLLVFKGKSVAISETQRQYWKNGNKNELVICLDSKLNWSNSFSWCDNKEIQVNTNEIFRRKDINFKQKIWLLEKEINRHWKRKNFSDFNYIKVPLTSNQIIWIYVVVCILTFGLLIFGVKNEIEENKY